MIPPRGHALPSWRAGLALSALLLAGAALAQPAETNASVWKSTDWTDLQGRTWTAESLEGKVVLVDFWATWCAPCLAQLPHLKKLDERYRDDGLVILGIALDTLDRRQLHGFLQRHGVTWPQVHEPRSLGSEPARKFSVEAVPATRLIDRQGRLVAQDLKGRALEAAIEALLRLDSPASTS